MDIKKIILVSLLVLIVLCFALPAFAQTNTIPVPQPKGTASGPLEKIITNMINIAYYIVGSVAILFLIIGGFQFIIAAGNPQGIQTAKSTIINVVIGLAIVILSNVIVQFIIKKLTS